VSNNLSIVKKLYSFLVPGPIRPEAERLFCLLLTPGYVKPPKHGTKLAEDRVYESEETDA